MESWMSLSTTVVPWCHRPRASGVGVAPARHSVHGQPPGRASCESGGNVDSVQRFPVEGNMEGINSSAPRRPVTARLPPVFADDCLGPPLTQGRHVCHDVTLVC